MKKTLFAIPVLAAVMLASLGFGISLNGDTATESISDGIRYNAVVSVYKNGELIDTVPNALTTNGEDMIKRLIGAGGTSVQPDYIALGNGLAPTASSTSLHQELNGSGLDRAQGTYASAAGTGNWTISHTFTATGAVSNVNSSALFNASAQNAIDGIFAAATYTAVDLQSADQLTIKLYV